MLLLLYYYCCCCCWHSLLLAQTTMLIRMRRATRGTPRSQINFLLVAGLIVRPYPLTPLSAQVCTLNSQLCVRLLVLPRHWPLTMLSVLVAVHAGSDKCQARFPFKRNAHKRQPIGMVDRNSQSSMQPIKRLRCLRFSFKKTKGQM